MKTITLFVLVLALSGCRKNPLAPTGSENRGYIAASNGFSTSNPNNVSLFGGAEFYLNGERFNDGRTGRGMNIAAVNRSTGRLVRPVQQFDTFSSLSENSWLQMVSFLDELPNGTVVMFAVEDEGGLTDGSSGGCAAGNYSPSSPEAVICCRMRTAPNVSLGRRLIQSYGSTLVGDYCYRNSWSMISVKGEGAKAEVLSRSGVAKSHWTP